MPQTYYLPSDLGQAILDYLVKRPYVEVHELVHAIRQLKPAVEPETPEVDRE